MSSHITAYVCFVCFAALSIGGVYLVKYSAQSQQRDVVKLRAELAAEQESLHLLHAEWAYLNRPERLQQLASRHLALTPIESAQIIDANRLPAARPAATASSPIMPAVEMR